MSAVELLLAFEYRTAFRAIFLAIVLAVGLWVPAELSPRAPLGAGDTHPGRRGDPAPGKPDAQAGPYESRTQR